MNKWTRRAFISTGVIAGTGLIVGVSMRPGNRAQKLNDLVAADGETLVHAYVKIDSDNIVTAILPHSEMGQGIHTALAQMVAEELDADWSLVRAEEAPALDEYANYAVGKGFLMPGAKFPDIVVPSVDGALMRIADVLNVNIRDLIPNDKIEDKVIIKHHHETMTWNFPEDDNRYHFIELANSKTLPYSKSFEIDVCSENKQSIMDLKMGLHQYVYNVSEENIFLNWSFNEKLYSEKIHPGDSVYIKPFVSHNFRGNGKLLVLRLGGKIVGDSQRELSIIGKENVKRAVDESMQWFDPKGHN